MHIEEKDGGIEIGGCDSFDVGQTFDCGQCFRFAPLPGGDWAGIAFGRYLRVSPRPDGARLIGTGMEDFEGIWRDFFDLDTDYRAIKEKISTDEIIGDAIEKAGGIRLLRQDLWETLISFIVSQNNNIPRMKKIIEAICAGYGRSIDTPAGPMHAFPSPQELCRAEVEDLHELGAGYRDEYIHLAAKAVAEGSLDLEGLCRMDTAEARKTLLAMKGIGGKVADCILLFGMHRTEVCPHDVWVKRIFSEKYHIENITEKKGYAFATPRWGEYAGIAQQYLFHACRGEAK